MSNRGVAQLVECAVWDREVAGSSPVTPTASKKLKIVTGRETIGSTANDPPAGGTSEKWSPVLTERKSQSPRQTVC